MMAKFKQLYGENINAAFTVEHNAVFWNNQERRGREVSLILNYFNKSLRDLN